MKKIWWIIGGVIILGILVYLASFLFESSVNIAFENNRVIEVEVADSEKEWSKGLLGVSSLGENKGMLFVYPDEEIRHFWMKDMEISLDIVFLDSDKKIISIQIMKPCRASKCIEYSSHMPAKYAIEVNEGFASDNQLRVGQKVMFEI